MSLATVGGPYRYNTYQELEWRKIIALTIPVGMNGVCRSFRGHSPFDPEYLPVLGSSAAFWNQFTSPTDGAPGYRLYRPYGSRVTVNIDEWDASTFGRPVSGDPEDETGPPGYTSQTTSFLHDRSVKMWLFADKDPTEGQTEIKWDCVAQYNKGIFKSAKTDANGMSTLKASMKMKTGQIWPGQQNYTFNWTPVAYPESCLTPWFFNLWLFRPSYSDLTGSASYIITMKITYFVEFAAPRLQFWNCNNISVMDNQDDVPAIRTAPPGYYPAPGSQPTPGVLPPTSDMYEIDGYDPDVL